MEKQKTAIDFAIEKADDLWDKFPEFENAHIRDAITDYIEDLKSIKSTTEREQLIEAFGTFQTSLKRREIAEEKYNELYGSDE